MTSAIDLNKYEWKQWLVVVYRCSFHQAPLSCTRLSSTRADLIFVVLAASVCFRPLPPHHRIEWGEGPEGRAEFALAALAIRRGTAS